MKILCIYFKLIDHRDGILPIYNPVLGRIVARTETIFVVCIIHILVQPARQDSKARHARQNSKARHARQDNLYFSALSYNMSTHSPLK